MIKKISSLISNLKGTYRHYFVRKKSPISYIWWSNILRRDCMFSGSYSVAIATVEPDCAISMQMGAPNDNKLTITVYDGDNQCVASVDIKLSYRSMKRIHKGFNEASAISRRVLKEESE